jgi:hypothetical protein
MRCRAVLAHPRCDRPLNYVVGNGIAKDQFAVEEAKFIPVEIRSDLLIGQWSQASCNGATFGDANPHAIELRRCEQGVSQAVDVACGQGGASIGEKRWTQQNIAGTTMSSTRTFGYSPGADATRLSPANTLTPVEVCCFVPNANNLAA